MNTLISHEETRLEFNLFLLPYGDTQTREASIDQLSRHLDPIGRDQVTPQQLQHLISSRLDENVDQELSLEELEQLSGGVGLVDAMMSTTILMVIVSQSAGLFGNSMNALNKSQLRDGINGAISADIELVRHDVANWAKDSSMDGQLRYSPSAEQCDGDSLGSALLADTTSGLSAGTTRVSMANAPTKLQGIQINRTISVDPDNANLIKISYATANGSAISVNQSTTLSTPAQGWCA